MKKVVINEIKESSFQITLTYTVDSRSDWLSVFDLSVLVSVTKETCWSRRETLLGTIKGMKPKEAHTTEGEKSRREEEYFVVFLRRACIVGIE